MAGKINADARKIDSKLLLAYAQEAPGRLFEQTISSGRRREPREAAFGVGPSAADG